MFLVILGDPYERVIQLQSGLSPQVENHCSRLCQVDKQKLIRVTCPVMSVSGSGECEKTQVLSRAVFPRDLNFVSPSRQLAHGCLGGLGCIPSPVPRLESTAVSLVLPVLLLDFVLTSSCSLQSSPLPSNPGLLVSSSCS